MLISEDYSGMENLFPFPFPIKGSSRDDNLCLHFELSSRENFSSSCKIFFIAKKFDIKSTKPANLRGILLLVSFFFFFTTHSTDGELHGQLRERIDSCEVSCGSVSSRNHIFSLSSLIIVLSSPAIFIAFLGLLVQRSCSSRI